jgi:cytochrome c553
MVMIFAAALAGCGEPPRKPEAPRPPAPAPSADSPAAFAAFAAMSADEKRRHMEAVVMPAMAARFRAFDGEVFAAPSCRTCHGSEGFKMPNPGLPRLSPDGRFDLEMRHSPELTMFMFQEVVPAMRELLGEPELDCFRCHLPRASHR